MRNFAIYNADILEILSEFKNYENFKISKIFISYNPEISIEKINENFYLNTSDGKFEASLDEYKTAKKSALLKIKKTRFKLENGEILDFYGLKFQNLAVFNEKIDDKILALYGVCEGDFDLKFAEQIYLKNQNLSFQFPAFLDSFNAVLIVLKTLFQRQKFSEFYEVFKFSKPLFEALIWESLDKILSENFSESLEDLNFLLNDRNRFFAAANTPNCKDFAILFLKQNLAKIYENFMLLNEESKNSEFLNFNQNFRNFALFCEIFGDTLNFKNFSQIVKKTDKNLAKFENFINLRENGENSKDLTHKILKVKYKILEEQTKFAKISTKILKFLESF